MSNLLTINEDIRDVSIEETLKTSYLDYSMSVIIGRALPDIRDGLKPVHRRILFAMSELGISSRSAYKKSARIVGDVIGKYHPHGDTAVYDALVRMAQDFSMRAPLVDGQGNFGSVDGDSAAAMRYTEARLTGMAEELLRDIDKDTVDFVPNYDGSMEEPAVLPSRVPALLLNGSSGIAVGMATNIPPHNLFELIDAITLLVENPQATLEDIMQHIKGPDFPTGGTIFGRKGILDAYATGRGRIKLRAKTHIEKKGGKDIIIIDELPYQVNKARLLEQIDELAKAKTIEGISEVRDESDREGMRVVIELKRDAMSEIVINNLYKHTNMSVTFGIINLSIHNGEPKIYGILEILKIFLSHRKTVIIRRTLFELEKAKARAHILEGLRIAIDNIDEIVQLIKTSPDQASAKEGLVTRFALSEIQAQAILDMRLGRLTGLERDKIEEEYKALMAEIERLEAILRSEDILNTLIRDELLELKEKAAKDKEGRTERLTDIVEDYEDLDIEDLIPNEPMVVTMTHKGYIKRVALKQYEKQNRGGKGKVALTTYEDDFIENFFISNTHDTLMFITNFGQLYWLKVYKIPEAGRTAKGKAVVNLIKLEANEKIMVTLPTTGFEENKSIAFFTKNGIIKRTNLNEFSNVRNVGIRAINLDEGDEIVTAEMVLPETQEVVIFTRQGMCVRFRVKQDEEGNGGLREIGRTARGVTGIRFKLGDDWVVGAKAIATEEEEILTVSEKGVGKRTFVHEYRLTARGGKGVIAMKLHARTGMLVGAVITDDESDLMALTSKGKMIRVDMASIRLAGRNTSGVKVISLDDDDKVITIEKCPKEIKDDDESSEEGENNE